MKRVSGLLKGALLWGTTLCSLGAGAATLTRQPYLQRVGPDTATVAFRLDSACAASVRYGTHGSTDQVVMAPNSNRIQALVLTGLQPGTDYTYIVEACGARTTPVSFSTAPVPGTRHVHFTAMGDFGSNNDDQKSVAKAMAGRRPELFLMLGDNAYESGTEEEIQNNMFAPMEPLLSQVPFFAVPGNHEYVTDEAQPYLDNLYLPTSPSGGERYYSFDWGFIHFVAIDSSCAIGLASEQHCTLAAQKKWVEQDLAASTAPWKVAFFHHPPWSSGAHGSQLLMRREFSPLFEKYGVDLVLTGHDHDYERTKPMMGNAEASSGTPAPVYLVVGSGGATLRPIGSSASQSTWSVLRNDTDHGYLDVTARDGTLTAQLLTPSGKALDSFSLHKSLPAPSPTPTPMPVEGPPTTPTASPGPIITPPAIPTPEPGATVSPGPDTPRSLQDTEDPVTPPLLCAMDPVVALLPMGLWTLAGVLRRRRRTSR